MKWIWESYRNEIKVLFVYSVFVGIFSLVTPLAVQALVNSIAFTGLLQPIIVISLVVLLISAGNILLQIYKHWIAESIERKTFIQLVQSYKYKLDQKIQINSPLSEREQSLRLFEVTTLKKALTSLLLDGLTFLLQVGVGTILLAFYHPYFLALSILLILFTYWIIKTPFLNGIKTAAIECEEKHRIFSQINISETQFSTRAYLDARAEHFNILLWQKKSALALQMIFAVLVLGIGGVLVLQQVISVGQLVAAELIISAVVGNYNKLGKHLDHLYDLIVAQKKLNAILPENLDFKSLPETAIQEIKTLDPPKFMMNSAKVVAIFIGALVIGVFITPWQQTSFGEGRVIALSPNDRETFIDAPVDGRLGRWFVQEGSFVKQGEPIVELFDNDPDILERLEREKNAIETKLRAARASAEASRKNVDRQNILFSEGISSKRQLELAEIEYAKQLSEEASSSADLARIETRLARQANQNVQAPRSGTVLRRKAGEISVQVKSGDWLATLVPETDSRSVEIYIRGIDLALVRLGQDARIQFEGWPAIQFSGWPEMGAGTFQGLVSVIDAADSGGGKFRVLITPKPGFPWPDRDILRQGIRAMGWIQLGRVSVAYELWRRMNGFPPLPTPVKAEGTEAKK